MGRLSHTRPRTGWLSHEPKEEHEVCLASRRDGVCMSGQVSWFRVAAAEGTPVPVADSLPVEGSLLAMDLALGWAGVKQTRAGRMQSFVRLCLLCP